MRSLRDYGRVGRNGIPADVPGGSALVFSRRYALVHLRTVFTLAAIASFAFFLLALRGHDERIRKESKDASAACESSRSWAGGLPHSLACQPKATSRELVGDAIWLATFSSHSHRSSFV